MVGSLEAKGKTSPPPPALAPAVSAPWRWHPAPMPFHPEGTSHEALLLGVALGDERHAVPAWQLRVLPPEIPALQRQLLLAQHALLWGNARQARALLTQHKPPKTAPDVLKARYYQLLARAHEGLGAADKAAKTWSHAYAYVQAPAQLQAFNAHLWHQLLLLSDASLRPAHAQDRVFNGFVGLLRAWRDGTDPEVWQAKHPEHVARYSHNPSSSHTSPAVFHKIAVLLPEQDTYPSDAVFSGMVHARYSMPKNTRPELLRLSVEEHACRAWPKVLNSFGVDAVIATQCASTWEGMGLPHVVLGVDVPEGPESTVRGLSAWCVQHGWKRLGVLYSGDFEPLWHTLRDALKQDDFLVVRSERMDDPSDLQARFQAWFLDEAAVQRQKKVQTAVNNAVHMRTHHAAPFDAVLVLTHPSVTTQVPAYVHWAHPEGVPLVALPGALHMAQLDEVLSDKENHGLWVMHEPWVLGEAHAPLREAWAQWWPEGMHDAHGHALAAGHDAWHFLLRQQAWEAWRSLGWPGATGWVHCALEQPKNMGEKKGHGRCYRHMSWSSLPS